jgi:hypothetical protein
MYVVPPAGGSHLAAKGILVDLLRPNLGTVLERASDFVQLHDQVEVRSSLLRIDNVGEREF